MFGILNRPNIDIDNLSRGSHRDTTSLGRYRIDPAMPEEERLLHQYTLMSRVNGDTSTYDEHYAGYEASCHRLCASFESPQAP